MGEISWREELSIAMGIKPLWWRWGVNLWRDSLCVDVGPLWVNICWPTRRR